MAALTLPEDFSGGGSDASAGIACGIPGSSSCHLDPLGTFSQPCSARSNQELDPDDFLDLVCVALDSVEEEQPNSQGADMLIFQYCQHK